MPRKDRVREIISSPPTPELVAQRAAQGWQLTAVIWEREIPDGEPELQDPPFGLRVAADAWHLEDDPQERAVLMAALANVVQDRRPAQIAEDLNRLGYKTRRGTPWTAISVFELLPRMIEAGSRIFSTPEWDRVRRQTLRSFITE